MVTESTTPTPVARGSLEELVAGNPEPLWGLTGQYENILKLSFLLKNMGLGEEFGRVGNGLKAMVIAPTFTDDIVIRISDAVNEPGFRQWNYQTQCMERVHRPKIPEVLQPLYVERLEVYDEERMRTVSLRVEILPRLRVTDKEKHSNVMESALGNLGYNIGDAKPQNIGLCKDGTPVLLDPGELTYHEKRFKVPRMMTLSALRGYGWSFHKQTAHLTRDWGKYVRDSVAANQKEFEDLYQRMIAVGKSPTHHQDHVRNSDGDTPDGNTGRKY